MGIVLGKKSASSWPAPKFATAAIENEAIITSIVE